MLRFYPAEGEVVEVGEAGEGVESKGLVAKTMAKFWSFGILRALLKSNTIEGCTKGSNGRVKREKERGDWDWVECCRNINRAKNFIAKVVSKLRCKLSSSLALKLLIKSFKNICICSWTTRAFNLIYRIKWTARVSSAKVSLQDQAHHHTSEQDLSLSVSVFFSPSLSLSSYIFVVIYGAIKHGCTAPRPKVVKRATFN